MRLIAAIDTNERHSNSARFLLLAAVSALSIGLAGCNTTAPIDTIAIDRTQGTDENIASLTDVIQRNPSNPEGYNVRGSAYGVVLSGLRQPRPDPQIDGQSERRGK